MRLLRVDHAIQACEHHLASVSPPNPEIEVFLTSYLLVTTYSEYSRTILDLVSQRVTSLDDPAVAGFVRYAAGRILRSFRLSELSDFLGRFGPDCKKAFADAVLNKPTHLAYDRIMLNRHDIAHDDGSLMTFPEFKQAYQDSGAVIDAFALALGCDVAP
jgi:hypothetical protein